jgi:hypothetical protein
MTVAFTAGAAAYLRDDDIETELVILAEHEDGSGRRLEIQRSLVITEQDRAHGMDTYCVVDQDGRAHYGGVEGWFVSEDRFRLSLDAGAQEELAAPGGYEIYLRCPPLDPQRIERDVRRVLRLAPLRP